VRPDNATQEIWRAGVPHVIERYVRGMDRISDWVGTFAMYLIYVMIAVLIYDVVTDKMFGMTQNWVIEFAQFTLAAFYFMGGAKTLKDNNHVRMDLIYANLTEKGKARVDVVTVFFLIFYLVILLRGSVSSLMFSWETNQRLPSLWAPSLVPIKALMVVCLVLMLLQSVALFFRHVATIRGVEIA
jgi:TRAP-type mannitol/chloroaromatic compound transport system permease small subunit